MRIKFSFILFILASLGSSFFLLFLVKASFALSSIPFVLVVSISFLLQLIELNNASNRVSATNTFLHSRDILLTKDNTHKALAFYSLIELERNNYFKKEIDFIFKTINFEGMNLEHSDLKKANLSHTKLNKSIFMVANLEEINFKKAYLEKSIFIGAHMQEANLQGANLRKANFLNAYLWGADLEGADLAGARLENAYFLGANLLGANLEDAILKGAYLKGAKISQKNLEYALKQKAFTQGAIIVKEETE